MGEARRKQLQLQSVLSQLDPVVAEVASALRRLSSAASANLGRDCYTLNALAQPLLKERGVEAALHAGYAAWRVGPGPQEIIAHAPEVGEVAPCEGPGFLYHAWLSCGGCVVDITMFQLPRKAAELDAVFGGHTTLAWAPEYVIVPPRSIRSLKEVARASVPGTLYYERHAGIEAFLRDNFTLDPQDLAIARLIMRHPETQVFGPYSKSNDPS